jgi:hypothetical protein
MLDLSGLITSCPPRGFFICRQLFPEAGSPIHTRNVIDEKRVVKNLPKKLCHLGDVTSP